MCATLFRYPLSSILYPLSPGPSLLRSPGDEQVRDLGCERIDGPGINLHVADGWQALARGLGRIARLDVALLEFDFRHAVLDFDHAHGRLGLSAKQLDSHVRSRGEILDLDVDQPRDPKLRRDIGCGL